MATCFAYGQTGSGKTHVRFSLFTHRVKLNRGFHNLGKNKKQNTIAKKNVLINAKGFYFVSLFSSYNNVYQETRPLLCVSGNETLLRQQFSWL